MNTRHQRRRRFASSSSTSSSSAATATATILLCLASLSRAQSDPNTFDCGNILVDGPKGGAKLSYNLTSIAGVRELTRTRDTPPTKNVDELRFDLCGEVPKKEGVAEGDQCPSGTRACLTVTNQKDSNDRVTSVIQLAASDSLKPEVKVLTNPDALNIILHGPPYPPSSPAGSPISSLPQSLNITLICDSSNNPSSSPEPEWKSYNFLTADVEWTTGAGCRVPPGAPGGGENGGGDGNGDTGGKEEDVGSGIGWFFLLFLLAFIVYFALGAYYNYSTYGATGLDLIPHRDFWRDVPYIIRDVVSHLCSTVRPKRGGYIAV